GTARPEILFPAYRAGFTLAESFYMALPHLSWQAVVVGDPLAAPFGPVGNRPAPVSGIPYFLDRRARLLESMERTPEMVRTPEIGVDGIGSAPAVVSLIGVPGPRRRPSCARPRAGRHWPAFRRSIARSYGRERHDGSGWRSRIVRRLRDATPAITGDANASQR